MLVISLAAHAALLVAWIGARPELRVAESPTLEVQLEVASLATGHLTVLPHTWATGDPQTGLGWPGNDDRLVAKLNTGSEVQMLFWAPGHRAPALASVRGSQNPADIVVGS